MNKKPYILLSLLITLLFAGAADAYTLVSTAQDSRMSPLTTLETLRQKAEIIFTGTCVTASPIFQSNTLYTLSEVTVDTVYQGDAAAGETLLVLETGGFTTAGQYQSQCHITLNAQSGGPEPLPDDEAILVCPGGFPPLQPGEQALLFVVDTTGFLTDVQAPVYYVVGDHEGKLLLQPDGSYQRPFSGDAESAFPQSVLTITPGELAQLP